MIHHQFILTTCITIPAVLAAVLFGLSDATTFPPPPEETAPPPKGAAAPMKEARSAYPGCVVAIYQTHYAKSDTCKIKFAHRTNFDLSWIDRRDFLQSLRNASDDNLDALANEICTCNLIRVHSNCSDELHEAALALVWRCYPEARETVKKYMAAAKEMLGDIPQDEEGFIEVSPPENISEVQTAGSQTPAEGGIAIEEEASTNIEADESSESSNVPINSETAEQEGSFDESVDTDTNPETGEQESSSADVEVPSETDGQKESTNAPISPENNNSEELSDSSSDQSSQNEATEPGDLDSSDIIEITSPKTETETPENVEEFQDYFRR